MQQLVWLITAVVVICIGAVFVAVALGAHRRKDYDEVRGTAYRLRTKLFWGLIVAGIIIAAGTLRSLPYVHAEANAATQIIAVTGHQFYWELDKETVVAGQPVEFRVTSTDVNHGFGIYDADYRLLAQVQAMPGYINHLRYTFETPGTYRLLCLEFCGAAHHGMVSEIEVKVP